MLYNSNIAVKSKRIKKYPSHQATDIFFVLRGLATAYPGFAVVPGVKPISYLSVLLMFQQKLFDILRRQQGCPSALNEFPCRLSG